MSPIIFTTIKSNIINEITSLNSILTAEKHISNLLNKKIWNKDREFIKEKDSRLDNVNIQTSSYGDVIPIVYGTMRLAGNVIWAQPIKEVNITNIDHHEKPRPISRYGNDYNYYVTLAIAICAGEVQHLIRVWADKQLLNLNELIYRFYNGSEEQKPDPLILSIEGSAPAYRGIAYIVIEDFLINDYNNKIPNFTFEVTSYPKTHFENNILVNKINSIHILPGLGEFAYDTKNILKTTVKSVNDPNNTSNVFIEEINHNNLTANTDAILSLNQLKTDLPNVKWVSVAVNWYISSLDIKNCQIYPAVEYKNITTTPDEWQVSTFNRLNAKLVTHNATGKKFGGTINDISLLRYLDELKIRGYKIMLYPMLILDDPSFPHQAYINGDLKYIDDFFINQYSNFILHYCNLTDTKLGKIKDKIDAFVIGSRLSNLTKIKNNSNDYPAVNQLKNLAYKVKKILGNTKIVTYAADWNEYHSTLINENTISYNLDSLWSDPNIDVVGINAYFPLTDKIQPSNALTIQGIVEAWNSGEGYDYFYQDPKKEEKIYYKDARFAWKNIEKWWNEKHLNFDEKYTNWQPKMKKIWFIECGFNSIDNASNQSGDIIDSSPNLSSYSQGKVDFFTQKICLEGTLIRWHNSNIIEKIFIVGWDVRPFPYFPTLTKLWSDSYNWEKGYWIQGKVSLLNISDILLDILKRTNVPLVKFDFTQLHGLVAGYIINKQYKILTIIETLQKAYFFDIIEKNSSLIFQNKDPNITCVIPEEDIIPTTFNNQQNIINIHNTNSINVINKIDLLYLDRSLDYQINSTYAKLNNVNTENLYTISLPLVLDETQAHNIAEITLYDYWYTKDTYNFVLPVKYCWLSSGDTVKISHEDKVYLLKIVSLKFTKMLLYVEAKLYNYSIYNMCYSASGRLKYKLVTSTPKKIIPQNLSNIK